MKYIPGQFVLYIAKNEVGLVSEVLDDGFLRCWWHTGGTRAKINEKCVEPVAVLSANDDYSNAYAIKSLLKRRSILLTCEL